MTQTVDEKVNPNDYSFSRLLDPLEIYDNNIKATEPPVDMEQLKNKIQENVEQAFERLKERLVAKYTREVKPETPNVLKKAPSNPQQSPLSHDKFKQFIGQKMALVQQEHTPKKQEEVPELFSSGNIPSPRTERKKMSPAHSSSQDFSSYLKGLARPTTVRPH